MSIKQHKYIPYDEVHAPHSWEFANKEALLVALPMNPVEIGRWAFVRDTKSYWRLESVNPINVWEPVQGNSMFIRLQSSSVQNIEYSSGRIFKVTYDNGIYCQMTYLLSGVVDTITYFSSENVELEKWKYYYDINDKLTSSEQLV